MFSKPTFSVTTGQQMLISPTALDPGPERAEITMVSDKDITRPPEAYIPCPIPTSTVRGVAASNRGVGVGNISWMSFPKNVVFVTGALFVGERSSVKHSTVGTPRVIAHRIR